MHMEEKIEPHQHEAPHTRVPTTEGLKSWRLCPRARAEQGGKAAGRQSIEQRGYVGGRPHKSRYSFVARLQSMPLVTALLLLMLHLGVDIGQAEGKAGLVVGREAWRLSNTTRGVYLQTSTNGTFPRTRRLLEAHHPRRSRRGLLQTENIEVSTVEILGAEIRNFYWNWDVDKLEWEEVPMLDVNGNPVYNMFFRSYGDDIDLGNQMGVRANLRDPTLGTWKNAAMSGACTINFVTDRFYTYLPGEGDKTDNDCVISDETFHSKCMSTEECIAANKTLSEASGGTRCDQFKGGDLNPYGLRIVDYETGDQVIRPVIKVIPQAFEYDVLSNSILALVTWYPLDNPAFTQDEYRAPILSLVAINETTGMIHECPQDELVCSPDAASGQQSMTFCKECPMSPKQLARDWINQGVIGDIRSLELDYDYTQVAPGSTAFDALSQVFYAVLSNPNVERSETLFAVKRLSILQGDEDELNGSPYYYYGATRTAGERRKSEPLSGIWIVEFQWDQFKHWQWPAFLMRVGSLEFGPKQVQRVYMANGVATEGFEPVDNDEKTLFAACGIKERGACFFHRCGHVLTALDIQTYESEDRIHEVGQVCQCPHTMVQINVNVEGEFVAPTDGDRIQPANTDNAETRWTGSRDAELLAETFIELAILDERMAGYHPSVTYLLAGQSENATGESYQMPGRPASPSRRLLDFVALDVETNEPIFDSRSEALRDLSSRAKPPPSGTQEGVRGRGRHLQQDAAVETTTAPFTNLIHGVGAFMAPVRELGRSATYFTVDMVSQPDIETPGGGPDTSSLVMYNLGLGGQRQKWITPSGHAKDWAIDEYANCYTEVYCDWLAVEDPDVYSLEAGTFPDYSRIPESLTWSERYLCLTDNLCKPPHPDPAQGIEVVKIFEMDAFPLFVWNTGADSKAIETPLRLVYPFPTVGRYSYVSDGPYYSAGILQPPYKGIEVIAGEEHIFVIQAIDKLGFAQTMSTINDNFTVAIKGPGFPSLCPDGSPQTCRDSDIIMGGFVCRKCIQHVYYQTQCVPGETTQNCRDDERVVDEVENPAEMPIKDIVLGPVWTWEFQVAGSTRTTQDYQFSLESHYTEAEFPSIHDERYGQAWIPDSEQTPVETDPLCNSKGGTTTHAPDERTPLRNKCVRRLIRPVYIWGTDGQYMVKFTLDRIGIFSLDIKFRGEEPIFLDGRLNTGSRIMGGPYAIVVKPNLAKAAWTTASGAGLYNTTVGERGFFNITARDRFGNRVSTGGTEVRVVMAIGRARAECTSPVSLDADGNRVFPWEASICTGRCLAADLIINPTEEQRADPAYYTDWVSWCRIDDDGTGNYRVTHYLTRKNKGFTWYTTTISVGIDQIYQSPFSTFAAQRESYAPESFATNVPGSSNGVATAVAGRVALMLVQARDRFANFQNLGGDPFRVELLDPLFRVYTSEAQDYRSCPQASDGDTRRRLLTDEGLWAGNLSLGASSSEGGVVMTTEARRRSLLDWVPGVDFRESSVGIAYDKEGIYLLNYTVFKRGYSNITVTLEPCAGPPALHLGAYDDTMPKSPFIIYVMAAETSPGACVPVDGHMDAVTSFYVGNQSVVGKARGATMLLQLRDRYGNNREEAEALYLSDSAGTYYPLPRFQYNLDPTATGLTDATTQNIKARTYAGLDLMPLMEVPISEIWVNNRIVINPSVQYEAEGMFRITWTTTLAGSYDVALLVLPILPDQMDWESSKFSGVCGYPCTEANAGVATIEDPDNGLAYQHPYPVNVLPVEADVRMFELFYWVSTDTSTIFWSSLMGVTHNFETTDGAPASPNLEGDMFILSGLAGEVGHFYIQARDKFGNLLEEDGLVPVMEFLPENGGTAIPVNFVDFGGESPWDRSQQGADVSPMGSGYFKVEYNLFSQDSYGISLTLDGLTFLRKLTVKDETTIKTLGYPTWSYGGLFMLNIGPAPLSARECTSEGTGLMGGVVGDAKTVIINARDSFGNLLEDSVDATFKLQIARCSSAQSASCDLADSAVARLGQPQSFATVTASAALDGSQYSIGWTPLEGSWFQITAYYEDPLYETDIMLGGVTSAIFLGDVSIDGIAGQEQYVGVNFAYSDGFEATSSPRRGQFKYFPIYVLVKAQSDTADPSQSMVLLLQNGMLSPQVWTGSRVDVDTTLALQAYDKDAVPLSAAKLDLEPFSYIKAELKNTDGKIITRSKQCTANGFVSDGIEWDPLLKVHKVTFNADSMRSVDLTSPDRAGDDYAPIPNTITLAGIFTLTVEAVASVYCYPESYNGLAIADPQPVFGYNPELEPYHGEKEFTPGSTNTATSLVLDGTVWNPENPVNNPPSMKDALLGGDSGKFTRMAGVLTYAYVQSRDKYDNIQDWSLATADGYVNTLREQNGLKEEVALDILDMNTGMYNSTFMVTRSGTYWITVMLGEASVSNLERYAFSSDFGFYYLELTVTAAPRDIQACSASGKGFTEASVNDVLTVNVEAVFQIEERDKYGNLRESITLLENGEPDKFKIYFDPQDVETEGPGARTGWEQTYFDLNLNTGIHPVIYFPGVDPATLTTGLSPPPLAATYLVSITDDNGDGVEVHTRGSPWTVAINPGLISVETCEVYGEGIIFNRLGPGTVKAGVEINVTIQAKDQYGNFLTAGGETTWALLLKTTPPEYLGQTSAGTVYDLGNGTYSGVYSGTINGILLMQIKRGTPIPKENFKYKPNNLTEYLPRPNEDPYKGTGGGAYATTDMINDFYPPQGFVDDPDYEGVLLHILPGSLSPYYTSMVTSDIIKGSGSCSFSQTTAGRGSACGEMEANSYLEFRINHMDLYGQPKNDEDDDRELTMELEYFADSSGKADNLVPYAQDTGQWEQEGGRWLCKQPRCLSTVQVMDSNGVATEVRESNPDDLLLLSRTGYYRLYVFVSLYNITMVPPELLWSRQIGQNNNCEDESDVHEECAEMQTSVLSDGNSFFEFYVKPAASSAGNSEIGTRRRVQRRRSRSLFSWALDDEEEMVDAGADEFDMLDFPRRRDAAARGLTQTSAITIEAVAGERRDVVIALLDSLGNAQQPDDSRQLDEVKVTLGELTCRTSANGTEECGAGLGTPCPWVLQPRGVAKIELTEGCTPVFVGFGNREDPTLGYDDELDVVTPDYGFPETPLAQGAAGQGLGLTVFNDFLSGSFVVNFTVDAQLPALSGEDAARAYRFNIQLNGATLGGGPFLLRVLPGAVSGPMSEVLPDISADHHSAVRATFTILAKDAFGNAQTASDQQHRFVVDFELVKESTTGTQLAVRGCTRNLEKDSMPCSFYAETVGDEGETHGNYTVSFTTSVASDYGRDYRVNVRYCTDLKNCGPVDNLYNYLQSAPYNPYYGYEPFVLRVLPGPVSALHSTAVGPDLSEGGLVQLISGFLIIARDEHGNRQIAGGARFEVLIYQPQGMGLHEDQKIYDHQNGTYSVVYMPYYSGLHSVIAMLDYVPIQGSPFDPIYRTSDAAMVPRYSRVVTPQGTDWLGTIETVAGQGLAVWVRTYQAPDTYGISRGKKTWGDTVWFKLEHRQLDYRIGHNQTVAEAAVREYRQFQDSDTDSSTPLEYTLEALSDYGVKDGVYKIVIGAAFTTRSGSYNLILRGCPNVCDWSTASLLRDAPRQMVVRAAEPDSNKSLAVELVNPALYLNEGFGWFAGYTAASIPSFSIQVRDRFGNNKAIDFYTEQTLKMEVTLTGQQTLRSFTQVYQGTGSDLANEEFLVVQDFDGKFLVQLICELAQRVYVSVRFNEQHITNSPAWAMVQPNDIDISNCVVQLNARGGEVGTIHQLEVQTRDAYDNHITAGGHVFRARLTLQNQFEEAGAGDNPLYAEASGVLPGATDIYYHRGLFTFGSDGKTVQAEVGVLDQNNGRYTVSYISQRAGLALLRIFKRVTLAGTDLPQTICTSDSARARCGDVATVTNLGHLAITFESSQPEADESMAFSQFNTLEKSTAGFYTTFAITAYDRYRNLQTSDGFFFTVQLIHQRTGRRILTNSIYQPSGQYFAHYTAKLAGEYTLSVKRGNDDLLMVYDNEVVQGPVGVNTPPLVVFPGSSTGATTVVQHPYVFGSDVESVADFDRNAMVFISTAGVESRFTITSYDEFGNQLTTGGEQFVIQVGFFDEGSYEDNGDGTYTGFYTETVAGQYWLQVFVNQQIVTRSNPEGIFDLTTFVYPMVVKGAETHAESCLAGGSGLYFGIAGEASFFTVTAHDRYFNAKIDGGDVFYANVSGLHPMSLVSQDNGDGTYRFDYMRTVAGTYFADISYNGIVFFDSSLKPLRIEPGSISLATQAVGDGLTSAKAFNVNEVHSLQIQLKDDFSNNITQGDTPAFKVLIATGSGSIKHFHRYEFEGLLIERRYPDPANAVQFAQYTLDNPYLLLPSIFYEVEYETPIAGQYSISITYLGKHLSSSPYAVVVETGPTGAGAMCTCNLCTHAVGPGLLEGVRSPTQDIPPLTPMAVFVIYARDIYGNARLSGGDEFMVTVTRPSGVSYDSTPDVVDGERAVWVEDVGDGTYRVNFTYFQEGPNTVSAELVADWRGRRCVGDCAVAHTPTVVNVQRLLGADLGPADARATYLHGEDAENMVAGQTGRFVVHSRKLEVATDFGIVYNRSTITGGLVVDVSAELNWADTKRFLGFEIATVAAALDFTVIDNQDGTYSVETTPTISGIYHLQVSIGGVPIAFSDTSMPLNGNALPPLYSPTQSFPLRVWPGRASVDHTVTQGIPFPPSLIPVSGAASFFNILMIDRFGNLVEYKMFDIMPEAIEVYLTPVAGGELTLRSIEQTALDQTITLRNQFNGTVTVSFTPFRSGWYDITVKLAGQLLTGSPVQQEVIAGSMNAEYMFVYKRLGDGSQQDINEAINQAFALDRFEFEVQGMDRYRNRLIQGGDAQLIVAEMMRLLTGVVEYGTVTDTLDGKYTVNFTLPRTGEYALTVRVNGAAVLANSADSVTGQGNVKEVVTEALNCYSFGSALEANDAGKPGEFFIQAVDRNDMVKQSGDDIFVVKIFPYPDLLNEYGRELPTLDIAPINMGRLIAAGGIPGQYRVDYLLQEFGDYNVSITYKGDHIKGSPSHLRIAKKLPPIPTRGFLSNTATKITVYFNDVLGQPFSTNRAGTFGHHSCDREFTPASVAMLGEGAYCSFPLDSVLDVYLGYEATVQPLDELALQPGRIYAVEENSAGATGSILVTKPASAPSPSIVIRAPLFLGLCQDMTLDASGSFGAAGRPLKYTYGMLPNVPNEQQLSRSLTQKSLTGDEMEITIPAEMFAIGYKYTIAVRVKNFLGVQSVKYHTLQRMPYPIPDLMVQGDPLLRVKRDQELFVRADIKVTQEGSSNCTVGNPEMSYQWSFNTDEPDTGIFLFDAKTKNSKNLYIRPYSLQAGLTYYLRVKGTVVGNEDLYNVATAVVMCDYSPLKVLVEMPMQMLVDEELLVDCTKSTDPDDPSPQLPQYPFGQFNFYFDCYNVTTDGVTVEPFPFNSCFDDLAGLMFPDPTSGKLILPNGTLAPGRYRFDIRVYKEPFFAPTTGAPLNRQVTVTRYLEVLEVARFFLGTRTLLDLDFDQAYSQGDNITHMEEFQNAFVRDMGTILNIQTYRIAIYSIAPGSINVTWYIKPPNIERVAEEKSLSNIFTEVNMVGVTVQFDSLEALLRLPVGIVNNAPITLDRLSATPEQLKEALNVTGDLVMPLVTIEALKSNIVNANEKLVIRANIKDDVRWRNQTTFYWSLIKGRLDLDAYPLLLGTPRTSSNLVIKKDSLAPGQEYVLRLTATNINSKLQGRADVEFKANGAPSSGTCKVEPKTGYATATEFNIVCSGWEDDDSQEVVEFEYRYYDPITNEAVPLVSRSRTNDVFVIMPPVTVYPDYTLLLGLFIVDTFNAKAAWNETITVYPPEIDPNRTYTVDCFESNYTLATYCDCFNDTQGDLAAMDLALLADSDSEGWVCVGSYNLTGSAAYTQQLIESRLRTARGTNNVPSLLTLAKAVTKLNNEAAAIRAAFPVPELIAGTEPTPYMVALEESFLLNSAAESMQLKAVLDALTSAVESSKVTREELDQFGAVVREATANPSNLQVNGNGQTASTNLLELAAGSMETGMDELAAQGLLDAAGLLVEANHADAREAGVERARKALLEAGGSPAGVGEEQGAAAQAAKGTGQDPERHTNETNAILSALAYSGTSNSAPGEDPFRVSSLNLQLQSEVRADPSGSYQAPASPGDNNGTVAPSFNVPAGLGIAGEEVDVVIAVNNQNPYGYKTNSSSVIQGNVASFSLKPHGEQKEREVSGLQTPVQIKIPMTVSGSVCRQQTGGCRFWDAELGDWSTEGMFERERTPDYILCESVHLSTFAISADDVVPEFALPNPDAELFASINLENALAIFVVGFVLFGFSVANFIGYKKDCRDRAKRRLAAKISTVDARLAASKGLNLEPGGALSKPGLAKGGAPATDDAKSQQNFKSPQEMMANAIKTQHNLVSIIAVEPGDDFTRPQRLVVLLNIVLGQIAISAVFFGMEAKNIGAKVLVGAITAVVLAPSKFAFKMLFKKSTFRRAPTKMSNRKIARLRKREQKKSNALKKAAAAQALMSVADKGLAGSHRPEVDPIAAAALLKRSQAAGESDDALNTLPGASSPFVSRPQRRATMRQAAGALGQFVPPPPAPPAGGKMRPRRRGTSSGGSHPSTPEVDQNGRPVMGQVPPPPPPPPGGAGMRPARPRRPSSARSGGAPGAGGGQMAPHVPRAMLPPPPPPPPTDKPMRPRRHASRPGSAASGSSSRPSSAGLGFPPPQSPGGSHGQQLMLYSPDYVPPPPPEPPAAGAPLRPQRSRARAAMLAAVGMNVFASKHGGQPTALMPPPPPPEDPGHARPRRASKRPSSGSSTPTTPATSAWGEGPTAGRGKRKPARPGAGRSRRITAFSSSSLTAARELVETAQEAYSGTLTPEEGAIIVRPTSARHEDLAAAVRAAKGSSYDLYVPDAILFCVIRIQRAWRRHAAAVQAKREKAVMQVQRRWRGHLARKRIKADLQAKAKGRTVDGLWWVTAHVHATPKAKDKREQAKQEAEKQGVLYEEEGKPTWQSSAKQPLDAETGELAGTARTDLSSVSKRWTGKQMSMGTKATAYQMLQAAALERRDMIKQNKERLRMERRRKLRERKRRAKQGLPRWCIYIAYAFSFVFCAFSSFMIVYFGLVFEPAVSRAWLLSSIFSLMVEFFVTDPAKIAALGVVKTRIQLEMAAFKQRRLDMVNSKMKSKLPEGRVIAQAGLRH